MPGDIGAKTEKKLVEIYGNKLKSDILVAPHHGSASSSSQEFLLAVAPKMAIFSYGYLNKFGHPNNNVVNLYKKFAINQLHTVKSGSITFKISGNDSKIDPEFYRVKNNNYWNSVF